MPRKMKAFVTTKGEVQTLGVEAPFIQTRNIGFTDILRIIDEGHKVRIETDCGATEMWDKKKVKKRIRAGDKEIEELWNMVKEEERERKPRKSALGDRKRRPKTVPVDGQERVFRG